MFKNNHSSSQQSSSALHSPNTQSDFTSLSVAQQQYWWQHSWLGYVACLAFPLIAWFILDLETVVKVQDYFVGILFGLGTFVVAWIWGTGPALLALVIGLLCTDYLSIPPTHTFSFYMWPNMLSVFPYMTIQVLFIWLIARMKRFQAHLLRVQQELTRFAENLTENNAQLVQADRVKDQFLSVASHELRTPVAGIYGSVQLLVRRIQKQSLQLPELVPVHEALLKVEVQIRRLIDLLTDLLDINRLHAGQMPLQLVPANLVLLCRKIIEEQQSGTDRHIELRFPSSVRPVAVDVARFSQVLRNLVSNALKYSPAGTPIDITMRQEEERTLIEVHNEGSALSPEQQQRIFEPFYRSPQAQVSSTPGWGLGLAISKELVEQHRGQLQVESAEGEGVTFTIILPA